MQYNKLTQCTVQSPFYTGNAYYITYSCHRLYTGVSIHRCSTGSYNMLYGLQYSVCVLLVTLIVLSAQGDALQMHSGKVAWTNCGESMCVINLRCVVHNLSLIGYNAWSSAGTENDIMKIDSILLNPKPIQSGHKFNFTAKTFLSK